MSQGVYQISLWTQAYTEIKKTSHVKRNTPTKTLLAAAPDRNSLLDKLPGGVFVCVYVCVAWALMTDSDKQPTIPSSTLVMTWWKMLFLHSPPTICLNVHVRTSISEAGTVRGCLKFQCLVRFLSRECE